MSRIQKRTDHVIGREIKRGNGFVSDGVNAALKLTNPTISATPGTQININEEEPIRLGPPSYMPISFVKGYASFRNRRRT